MKNLGEVENVKSAQNRERIILTRKPGKRIFKGSKPYQLQLK